jgi:hypothetical protein
LVGIEVGNELIGCTTISLRCIKFGVAAPAHLRELSARIVRERLPLPAIGVGA